MRFAMIMAGGSGTRLWPLSRSNRPKQLLPIIDGSSLLALSAARLEGVVPAPRRLVCTGETYRAAVRSALPQFEDEQILGEPIGRDTVNAVGFTAAVLAARDADAVFAVMTSDHLIEPLDEFGRKLELAFRLVESDTNRFVTFSIKPTFAATEYGWVERGNAIGGFEPATIATQFHEKPDAETARRYLDAGTFGWNSGMFVYHASTFMDALARFVPESAAGLQKIAAAWDTPRRREILEAVYPTLPKESVDRAVMTPASTDATLRVCCVPMDVSWRDVGSWTSFGETLPADSTGCRANAKTVHLDSENVLAVSDDPGHVIATIGCRDLIVVRTADATLVVPRDREQQVKDLVARLDESLR